MNTETVIPANEVVGVERNPNNGTLATGDQKPAFVVVQDPADMDGELDVTPETKTVTLQ